MEISRILVGYGDSTEAEDALALARVLAAPFDARLVLGRVVPWEPLPPPTARTAAIRQSHDRRAADQRQGLERAASDFGAEAQLITSGSAAHGLHDLAQTLGADLVVVGSSHRAGVGSVLAGSVAVGLLNGLDRPVAVAPRGYRQDSRQRFRRIGIGFNGSAEAEAALAAAATLASALDASLNVVAVAQPNPSGATAPWAFGWSSPELVEAARDRTHGILDRALTNLPGELRAEGRVVSGMPATILVEAAAKGMDLLVLGSRGYGPLRRVLLGSVSSQVVRRAPCPVLVVPRGAGKSPESEPAGSSPRATAIPR